MSGFLLLYIVILFAFTHAFLMFFESEGEGEQPMAWHTFKETYR